MRLCRATTGLKDIGNSPLHGQEGMFERHGVTLSRKTMCHWMRQCAYEQHPYTVYDYTINRGRDGPDKFPQSVQ